jgi:hypothetical protein
MSYATDRLMKNARIALPGSIDGAILLELFNVLDQFFRDTSIWTEDISFAITTGDPAGTIYYIEPESVSTIVRLMYVYNADMLQQRAFMSLPGEVTLLTPVGQSDVLTATVALSIVDPTNSNGYPEFPSWILEKYGTGILDGVLARMMLQPAKPYTSEKLGVAHMAAFHRTISHACTEGIHKNVHNAQAWIYPQQFSTRSRR